MRKSKGISFFVPFVVAVVVVLLMNQTVEEY